MESLNDNEESYDHKFQWVLNTTSEQSHTVALQLYKMTILHLHVSQTLTLPFILAPLPESNRSFTVKRKVLIFLLSIISKLSNICTYIVIEAEIRFGRNQKLVSVVAIPFQLLKDFASSLALSLPFFFFFCQIGFFGLNMLLLSLFFKNFLLIISHSSSPVALFVCCFHNENPQKSC